MSTLIGWQIFVTLQLAQNKITEINQACAGVDKYWLSYANVWRDSFPVTPLYAVPVIQGYEQYFSVILPELPAVHSLVEVTWSEMV